ncbi:GAP family protein [Promicromonospora iranensis]|uniref:Sap-like sulfolipid-1-addressing protein n=1 Tax=Promicromonospora iranensis TaxID=1105144 RepID=A0ABU2CV23_9MICO|nr:GAP family protein [Promicromonospora iranensis]MDR7384992.1 hypothetical protein [Promicromonospora iranensis]
MAELLVQLVPEILGLAATPAAIVACLLLLGSHRPYRNVTVFGGTVLVVYGALGAAALAVGRGAGAHDTDDPATVRGWIGLVVGVLFLVGGAVAVVRRPPPAEGAQGAEDQLPAWARRLASPTPLTLAGVATVLALLNPNVAIFVSGVGSVVTADLPLGQQAVGVLVLVLASVLDYVLPTVFYAVTGLPGRRQLHAVRDWLLRHDRAIGAAVLLVFGAMFTIRGLTQLLT